MVFHQTLGGMGVHVFFVTSGYLIFQSWQRDPSPTRYLVRRCLRIFPALLLVLLITAFVIGPMMSSHKAENYFSSPQTYQYLNNLFFVGSRGLPGVFEDNPYPITVNGGLWTLKYEFLMYLFLLGLGVVGNRIRVLLPVGLALGVAGSATVALLIALPLEHFPTDSLLHILLANAHSELSSTALRLPELAYYFLTGALFGYWRHLIVYRWSIAAILAIASFLLFASAWPGSIVVTGLFVAYSSLALGNARYYPLTRFGKYGDFSYGIYIYGFVVQQCVSSLLSQPPSWAIALALSFFVTLFFALVSWNLVEAPALAAKDHLCARTSRSGQLGSQTAIL